MISNCVFIYFFHTHIYLLHTNITILFDQHTDVCSLYMIWYNFILFLNL